MNIIGITSRRRLAALKEGRYSSLYRVQREYGYNSCMQPVPRKLFVECPRCHSPAVRVPWEPARAKGRRRAFQGLAALWSTAIAWVALALAKGDM